ncbi:carboxynorspermidine decarboxylase [Desulfovibrio ferrophilus]|uniref:Carboxynorspermidine/carboxyspermidine decarboxylase n=1 Tax=Desulfovibrio ferrophilus TaxID=241368 RepID=A0A2Z6B167_9BACT|nr:carboxynorspermidine decarboxylase [Desulfovibrio ferrophilus]BBD09205.1 carboxynorspermidine decarboxylase [Desulfovibrio ferrophilus]
MNGRTEIRFDPMRVPTTPAFVVDEALLVANLEILDRVRRESGAKVLLALKAFAMPRVFGLLRQTLDGVCASSPHEARLGREEFGREVHTFAAGYSEAHVRELALTTDHLVFNSPAQLERFGQLALDEAQHAGRELELALRINPEHSEGTVPLYDPCDPGSRLGIRRADFKPDLMEHITGLHFHTLCEQNADSLERTLAAVERRFGEFLGQMRYVNFGGGHHITRPDYDVDLLVRLIRDFRQRYGVDVYLEPGEAVALNTGYLVTEVLDIVPAGKRPVAILDTAVPCHMPDVIEMPYRPHVVGADEPGIKAHTYGLGGLSCLAGDMAGEYSFDTPLTVGDRLVFTDMAHYTMVKTNTFNGVGLPAIHLLGADSEDFELVRQFGYNDFKDRL